MAKLFFMCYGDVDTTLVAPDAGTSECIGSLNDTLLRASWGLLPPLLEAFEEQSGKNL
jgi:hypothetical protein